MCVRRSMKQAKAAREQAKAAKKRAQRNRVDTANTSSTAASETRKDSDDVMHAMPDSLSVRSHKLVRVFGWFECEFEWSNMCMWVRVQGYCFDYHNIYI